MQHVRVLIMRPHIFKVTFDSSVGTDGEDLIVNTYQDTHPSFSYTPASAWHTPSNVGFFVGGSGQCVIKPPIARIYANSKSSSTSQTKTTATFSFQVRFSV